MTPTDTPTSTPTATPTATPIDDGDGVPATVEDDGPNGGDGNGDHVLDSTQANVASLPSATGHGYITVVASGDGGCGELQNVQAMTEAAEGSDPSFAYPFGLISFHLQCTTITIFLHGADPAFPPAVYRKFGPVAPNFNGPSQFYTLPGVVFGTIQVPAGTGPSVVTATFTLRDNQLGDGSGTIGLIVDPSGPAIPIANSTPVVSSWGLAALVGLLSATAWCTLRRPRIARAKD
jgi:hypothetical protein